MYNKQYKKPIISPLSVTKIIIIYVIVNTITMLTYSTLDRVISSENVANIGNIK